MITNWAGNVRFQPVGWHRPRSMEELQRAIAGTDRVHVVGSAHSFNRVADTDGVLINLSQMPRRVEIDSVRRLVQISGGWTYGDLCPELYTAGWALGNLASLPHISVVGACATATHGSGRGNGCLADQVEEVSLLTADGDLLTIGRGDSWFPAAAAGLGALGVVTALSLCVRPTFDMIQNVYERIPLSEIAAKLEETMSSAYSVSLFTTWEDQPYADVWVKRVAAEEAPDAATPEKLFGVPATDRDRHPLPAASAEACTEQRTVGPWHLRLPHFLAEKIPASGAELQTEYFVAWEYAQEAIAAVTELGAAIRPALLLTEIRAVAADRLWLSPFCDRASIAIHFSWHNDWLAACSAIALVEEVLAPLDARPHWGKMFTFPHSYLERVYYGSMQSFCRAAADLDPQGRFRNTYVDRNLFGG